MPRFFVESAQINDGFVYIRGDDARHISRSLRMAKGDYVIVCDMQSVEYGCILKDFFDDCVTAQIVSSRKSDKEPPFYVHLYQAMIKGEKLDFVIQKAVECGVFSVTPFNSERCVAREAVTDETKLKRRNRISLEAAKQSGRGIVPAVNRTVSFDKMTGLAVNSDIALFCYEGEGTEPLKKVLREIVKNKIVNKIPVISVITGCEGGFTQSEVKKAEDSGMILTGLGKRILRAETASCFVLGCLVYEFEL